MKDYPWGKGTPTWVLDDAANDSDKSFTVPVGKAWLLQSLYAQLTATATVGNRGLVVVLNNGAANIWASLVVANVTASQIGAIACTCGGSTSTALRRLLAPNVGTVNASTWDGSLPDVLLPAGYVIRVYDANAIDAAADDLVISLAYMEYDA